MKTSFSSLGPNVQRLFVSNCFYLLANPIFSLFIGAFIWRTTGSFFLSGVYFAARFAFLPMAFAFNGILMRYAKVKTLFFFGTIMTGATAALVVLFTPTPLAIFVYGCLYGLSGLYWANRNYLELQETQDGKRQYFFSTLSALGLVANIVVPFCAGWFVVFGPTFGLYSAEHAYWILFGIAFLLMAATGLTVFVGKYDSVLPSIVSKIFVRPFWNVRRLLLVGHGTVDGLGFLSIFLALFLFGSEGVLGTINASAALFAAVCLYIYARFVNERHKYKLLVVSAFLSLFCAAGLAFLPSPLNGLTYLLLTATASGFFGIAVELILLSLTEKEIDDDISLRPAMVLDNELFLNVGRVLGIVLILVIAFLTSNTHALLYGPLLIVAIQLGFLALFFRYRE